MAKALKSAGFRVLATNGFCFMGRRQLQVWVTLDSICLEYHSMKILPWRRIVSKGVMLIKPGSSVEMKRSNVDVFDACGAYEE